MRRTPQVRQTRHIAVGGLVPEIDKEGGQADFLRLGVHGDFVFGFLLRVEEAGHEAVARDQLPGKEEKNDRGTTRDRQES